MVHSTKLSGKGEKKKKRRIQRLFAAVILREKKGDVEEDDFKF